MDVFDRKKDWLLPVAVVLFLLSVFLIPFAADRAYAGRSDAPDHILTYTTGSLTWDGDTNVDEETGAAEVSLFSSTYQNVQAENGDKVIAPGTEGRNIIRLKNDTGNSIQYTAVMYHMKEEDTLPVEPTMANDAAFSDTDTYPLPEGVGRGQVVRAVTGTVGADELQDFDIAWLWEYYESDERDQADTALGNKAAWETADEVQAGLYIVVSEDAGPVNPGNPDYGTGEFTDLGDAYIYPQVPRTGDSGRYILILILSAVGAFLFWILIWKRRKVKRCRKY